MALWPILGHAQTPVGTYSTLSFNAESGDLNGIELTFIPVDLGVVAVAQIAESGVNEVHLATAKTEGGRTRFSFSMDDKSDVVFDIKCTPSDCRGRYLWGNARVEVAMPLRDSYWARRRNDSDN
ncbi:MAG TPA: hypothetical protein VIT90_00435 [Lysobacter sp.]